MVDGVTAARLLEALVVGEEERAVLDDRSADDAAVLIALERRLPPLAA